MNLQNFIQNYTSHDFEKICFDNDDVSAEFRMQICEEIRQDFSLASDELLVDLYMELSKSSKQTFDIYRHYHLFAQEILIRKKEYLMYYLEGASYSIDTSMLSGAVKLDKECKEEIVQYAQYLLQQNPTEREERMLHFAIQRFSL